MYGNALISTIQKNSISTLIKAGTEYTANGNYVTNQVVTNGTAYSTQFGYLQGTSAYGSDATILLVGTIT